MYKHNTAGYFASPGVLSAFFYNESSKKEKEDFYGIRFTIRTLYCKHRNCVLE